MSFWEMFQFWFIKGFAEIVSGIALMIVIVAIVVMFVGGGFIKARWRARRDLKRKVEPQLDDVWIDEDDEEYRVIEIDPRVGVRLCQSHPYGDTRWWEKPEQFFKRRKEQGLHLRFRSIT